MARPLCALLLSLVFAVPVPATAHNWDKIISRAREMLVYTVTPKGMCSGFVIDVKREYVLTAQHCVESFPIYVDGKEAQLVVADVSLDLALLKALVSGKTPAAFGTDIATSDEVLVVGYAHGWRVPLTLPSVIVQLNATIPHFRPHFTMLLGLNRQPASFQGMSGGPVLNRQGKVIGITQIGKDAYAGMRPAAIIIQFLNATIYKGAYVL